MQSKKLRDLSFEEWFATRYRPIIGADDDGGADTATIEDVKKSVHDLAEAVQGVREGLIDKETVEKIAADVLAQQREAAPEANRRHGYQPDQEVDPDEQAGRTPGWLREAKTPAQRLAAIHQRPAERAAVVLGRKAQDVKRFQEAADDVAILNAVMSAQRPGFDVRETGYWHEEFLPACRAIDTQTAAEGQEFVPRSLSSNLIERVNLELRVAALFPTIPMPTNPFDIPGRPVSRTRLGKAAEQTADTGQTGFEKVTPGSRKVTLTAVKFAGEALFSKESDEDSIIAILPFTQDELVDYLSADIEDTTINGDTSGSHQDVDVSSSTDPRKNWAGLRKALIAGAKTDASNAALTVAMLRINRKNMGRYGVQPANLAHVLGIAEYVDLLSDSSVITVDKYGAQATILSGELGKVDGVPLIVSEYVRGDVNATGVYDGTTTNRTMALTVHRKGFVLGDRRGVEVQVLRELYAEYDQDAVIVTTRKAFTPRFPTATEKIVAQHYNVKT